ncbi:cation transporting ATPase C-terminal domain-containing protein [Saccharopolyspora sp. SCSIO 74807]|uniref:cation transporting ATPase C-terminal domain-containing protein n=1 Tax=Saccharopolyspora sp. SCSIO 74807 TaxID=3118084 RepID=UPI00387EA78F
MVRGAARPAPPERATVALVALIGAQLGQTLALRGRTPLVAAAALASTAALALAVQTPGVSTFFGSTPLWPHGWATALASATAATLASVVI